MTNSSNIFKKISNCYLLIGLCFTLITSCMSDKKSGQKPSVKKEKDNTITIVTENMDFQIVDTISAGWHTFKYINRSKETHFFLLDKYPEGITIENTEKEVGPVFQKGMDLINEGKGEAAFAEFGKLPEWFSEIVFSGGSGLISPGLTSETTVYLEPGYYIIECYVKMESGIFHSSMGMVKELIVSADGVNVNTEPVNQNVDISLSSTDGIQFSDTLKSGINVIAVHFKDQIVHENFVGHDINLARLEENANLKDLEKWMNWADPEGLISPSPEGIKFLGGVNDMPSGSVGYFNVQLEAGNYVLISEVPNASKKNMLKTFTIP